MRIVDTQRDNQKLVLVHGFGGSSIIFYKLMKALSEKYHLIMVDIIGMGGSSRPVFQPESHVEAEEFLVNSFEIWRRKVEITDFILAGHSFGGYYTGLYTSHYPQHVKKLLLLSPIGVEEAPMNLTLPEYYA